VNLMAMHAPLSGAAHAAEGELEVSTRNVAVVLIFATAMAWVEAAVVFYLRTMIDRLQPYQPVPLPLFGGLEKAELAREAATLAMLLSVGWLAGRTARGRCGYFIFAFGIWDLGYYLFLKVLTGWPHSLADWDILFLIPLPWWGPVWAPSAIAILMVLFGLVVAVRESATPPVWPSTFTTLPCLAGIILALYIFMTDSVDAALRGNVSLRDMLPQAFMWPWFLVALSLMACPVIEVVLLARKHLAPSA
jgi:hypothetical protein